MTIPIRFRPSSAHSGTHSELRSPRRMPRMPNERFRADAALAPPKGLSAAHRRLRLRSALRPGRSCPPVPGRRRSRPRQTMVARGVIARMIEHLWDSTKRIDIPLHLLEPGDRRPEPQPAERPRAARAGPADPHDARSPATARPGGLDANRVNFISLTPGTTFDLAPRRA